MIKKGILGLGVCAMIFFSHNGLSAQTWTKLPNSGKYIKKLYSPIASPQILVSCSDDDTLNLDKMYPFEYAVLGNGYLYSDDGGNNFHKKKLDSVSVFDIKRSVSNPNKWFAAVRYIDAGGVIVSSDNGETWNIKDKKCSSSSQITSIEENKFAENNFYYSSIDTPEGLSSATNGFENCIPNKTLNIQSRCISSSQIQPGLVFAGADAVYSDGVYHSSDSGKTWSKYESGLEGLRILCVKASSLNAGLVFAGADSAWNYGTQKFFVGKGIYVSQDTGRTWHRIGAIGSRVFDIQEHPQNPRHLAAAANTEGVFISSAAGFYWEQKNNGLPLNVNVRNVCIPNNKPDESGFICYAGTYGDGVYKSNPVKTDVENNGDLNIDLQAYPAPFEDRINLNWNNPKAGDCTIEIANSIGEKAFSISSFKNSGLQTVNLVLDNSLSAGAYLLTVKTTYFQTSKVIIKSR
jgi:hypothetical protein